MPKYFQCYEEKQSKVRGESDEGNWFIQNYQDRPAEAGDIVGDLTLEERQIFMQNPVWRGVGGEKKDSCWKK